MIDDTRNHEREDYMVMSRDQNAGPSHNIKTDNSSFEREEELRCLGTTLTDQNSIQEEIKGRLKSGNACCHSVQNLLSSVYCPRVAVFHICGQPVLYGICYVLGSLLIRICVAGFGPVLLVNCCSLCLHENTDIALCLMNVTPP
jgi:hypothetical protein